MKFKKAVATRRERFQAEWKEQRFRRLVGLLICLAVLFAIAEFVLGHLVGYMAPDACFQYLGCNVGYFGYDALVHWIAGLTEGIVILLMLLWHYQKVPPPHVFWKTVLVIFVMAVVLALGWELIEYAADLLHFSGFHPERFVPNQLGRQDTIGDILISIFGTMLAAVPILKYLHLVVASGKAIEGSHPQEN